MFKKIRIFAYDFNLNFVFYEYSNIKYCRTN